MLHQPVKDFYINMLITNSQVTTSGWVSEKGDCHVSEVVTGCEIPHSKQDSEAVKRGLIVEVFTLKKK